MKEFLKDYARNLFRLWKWLEKAATVLLLILIVVLAVSFMGRSKKLETTLDACVLTESGEVRTCEVYIKGELNLYPLRHDRDYLYTEPLGTGVRGISVNGKPGIGELYAGEDHKDLLIGVNQRGIFFMDREGSRMFAEMDASYLFPDMESQRCVVAAPARNLEELKQLLEGQVLPEIHWEKFSWLMD